MPWGASYDMFCVSLHLMRGGRGCGGERLRRRGEDGESIFVWSEGHTPYISGVDFPESHAAAAIPLRIACPVMAEDAAAHVEHVSPEENKPAVPIPPVPPPPDEIH